VPLPVEQQVVIIYAGTKGFTDKLPVEALGAYERELYAHITQKHPDLWTLIREKKAVTDDVKSKLEGVLKAFTEGFVASKG
jgi:F-type H+-transporting ATPase subunit alpha